MHVNQNDQYCKDQLADPFKCLTLIKNDFKIHNFDIKPSNSIRTGAKIDAQALFQKGIEFGQNYTIDSDYIILAESVPSGTTTAKATAMALGYDCENYFSSSFKDVPNDIKNKPISHSLTPNIFAIFVALSITKFAPPIVKIKPIVKIIMVFFDIIIFS